MTEDILTNIKTSIKLLTSLAQQVEGTTDESDLNVMLNDATHIKNEIEDTLNGKYADIYERQGINSTTDKDSTIARLTASVTNIELELEHQRDINSDLQDKLEDQSCELATAKDERDHIQSLASSLVWIVNDPITHERVAELSQKIEDAKE